MRDRILVVDDEAGAREGLRRLLEAWGYETDTASSGSEALERVKEHPPAAVITDLVMPGLDGIGFLRKLQSKHPDPIPVIVFTGQGTIEQAVEAIRLGAQDILEKPVDEHKLKIILEKLAGTWKLLSENRRMRAELRKRGALGPLRGISKEMRKVFEQIEQVAPSILSVLIAGESGTGKELVAQTLHELSPRRSEEFIALNCAAIPATLLESEIFGHERGSFTGAYQRKSGCFEMAHGGTLFLDEIAELDESLQAKLLRVLQEQRFRRVGGSEVIEADVRVLAATNRDPMQAIADGKLRADLYYRLNVFTITLPPLRDRPEDIWILAPHFAEQYAERAKTGVPAIDPVALARLASYRWPGNIRELKNAIERSALVSGGEVILPEHLPPQVIRDPSQKVPPGPVAVKGLESDEPGVVMFRLGSNMEEVEREMIRSTLSHTSGNKTRAAKILGISLKTMHNKVKKFQL